MIKIMREGLYNRDILIGLPKLTLKSFKCQNITCCKDNQFKKYKGGFICECGYITMEQHEIEETHKVKLYCTTPKNCPESKLKMDKNCLKCQCIGER